MPKLKVYGWNSFRDQAPGHSQTREIVATTSKVAAAKLAHFIRPSQMLNLCVTGNKEEIEQALSKPEAVFWRPLDKDGPWTEAPKYLVTCPNNCAVRQRGGDGNSLGRCWYYAENDVCPCHGDVKKVMEHYRKTGELGEDPRPSRKR